MKILTDSIAKFFLMFAVFMNSFMYACFFSILLNMVLMIFYYMFGYHGFDFNFEPFFLFFYFFSCLGFFRALLRVYPIQMGIDIKKEIANGFVFYLWIAMFFSFVAVILNLYMPIDGKLTGLIPAILGERSGSEPYDFTYVFWLFCFLFSCLFLIRIIVNFRKEKLFLLDDSVLFLRRFGSGGELELLPVLIGSLKRDQRVVMLIEQSMILNAWDFDTICFTPFFTTRLDRVCYLSGRDDEWERNVSLLVSQSKRIVMNASDISSSIQKEIDLIKYHNAVERTVWFTQISIEEFSDEMEKFGIVVDPGNVISTEFIERNNSMLRMFVCGLSFFYPLMFILMYLGTTKVVVNNFIFFGVFLTFFIVSLFLGYKTGGSFRIPRNIRKLLINRLSKNFS
ncbi:MAG: hypothetical protein ACK4XG_10030 [Chromatiaceae bacterium]|jgi:hypothetical protein